MHLLTDRTDTLTPANIEWLTSPSAAVEAVDSHAHVFEQGLPLAPQRRHAPEYDATLDAYVTHLREHGMSHAVLVQPSFLGTDNSFFLDVLERFPHRFRGVAVVDPAVSDAHLHRLATSGVVGIRLNLVGLPVPDLQAPLWRAFLSRVNALGFHVEVHRDAIDLPMTVGPLVEAGCTVVVDHFGRPDAALGTSDPGFRYLLSTASSGRVWVKLSAAYRSARGANGMAHGDTLITELLETFGPTRLVWGSDWPHTQHRSLIDYGAARAALHRWIPDTSLQQVVLRDAPRELFRLP
jgi:predicted TIM-barrel fold metal-dependent hydrolase